MINRQTILLMMVAFLVFACYTVTDDSGKVKSDSSHIIPNYKFESEATLTGKLEPIKYTNISGDWYNAHILILDSAISVQFDESGVPPVVDVTEIQLAFDTEVPINPDKLIGKVVTMTGKLFNEHTVHHRRPVLMSVKSVKVVK